jgi:recombination protein RecA|tara:strand:+ start:247 stop:1344 length:1098 start_codon:yes stop_codon:yes gene_type:complete
MSNRDELAEVIASELNKQFKSHQVAYFLDGVQEAPTDVTDWISTGSTILDLAISNRPNGGFAAGRIAEINGLESSGKSLIGAHALASTQRKDGLAVYIDTESAVSSEFLQSIGIDTDKMLYVHLETVEDIFDTIETIVTKIRESDKDKLVTILVDSLAAASTKVEMDADFDKDGWATAKAIVISKAMRKITNLIARQRVCLIFTNQLRQKLGVMFGDPWTTSGGKALPFHSSTRIRLKNMGQIKDTKKNTIGIKIRAQVIKNRLGPPLRSAEFPLYFDKGIDDFGSWLEVLKVHNLVKQGGAWYTMNDHTGKEIKFQSKDFESIMADVDFQEYTYDLICEKVILKYDSGKLGIDDVSTSDEFADE